MVVARKDSQLGVNLTNTINEASSSDFVVVDRVNGVYPMSQDNARDLGSGGKLEGVSLQGTDTAMATTYYTVQLGSLYELTKYRHEALGHATLENMICISATMEG